MKAFSEFSTPKNWSRISRVCSSPFAMFAARTSRRACSCAIESGFVDVAIELELGVGVEAVRVAGIAGDEDQLAVGRALRAPLEVVLARVERLAVLVDAEEGAVEVVARIREVVRVAAEERDLLLGGEDEPDVARRSGRRRGAARRRRRGPPARARMCFASSRRLARPPCAELRAGLHDLGRGPSAPWSPRATFAVRSRISRSCLSVKPGALGSLPKAFAENPSRT